MDLLFESRRFGKHTDTKIRVIASLFDMIYYKTPEILHTEFFLSIQTTHLDYLFELY